MRRTAPKPRPRRCTDSIRPSRRMYRLGQPEALERRQLLSTLFADDFNDNSIDPSRWSHRGSTVTEAGEVMRIDQNVTDDIAVLQAREIQVRGDQPVVLTRRTLVHYANQYSMPSLKFFVHDSESQGLADTDHRITEFGVNYANYAYNSGVYCQAEGFFLYRNGLASSACERMAEDWSSRIEPEWDRWFDERIVVDFTTGDLEYAIDGGPAVEFNIGDRPEAESYRLYLQFSAWGWWTGHEQHMDDLVVSQADSPCDEDATGEATFAFTKIADTNTAIPSATSTFTDLGPPAVEAENTAFVGYGPNGLQGVYTTHSHGLQVVADTMSMPPADPLGVREFLEPSVDDQRVAFRGVAVYPSQATYLALDGDLSIVVKFGTPLPGSSTLYNMGEPSLDDGDVSFVGCHAGACDGVYETAAGSLGVVANRSTPIPEGTGNFTFFGNSVSRDGSDVAFVGRAGPSQSSGHGIYARLEGSILRIADRSTMIPDSTGTFTAFVDSVSLHDGTVAFIGIGSSGEHGIYAYRDGALRTIADLNSTVPDRTETFTGFGEVLSTNNGRVAFVGYSASRHGVYLSIDHALVKVIDNADLLDGKTPDVFSITDEAIDGNSVAFRVGFADGSVGIYRAEMVHTCNEPPIADDQGELLDEDTSVLVTLTGTDPEGGDVTFAIVEPPAFGTLAEFDPITGHVVYVPEPNWHGLDTFTFVVNDGELDSEPATVYLRVDPVNDEPELNPPASSEYPVPIDEDDPDALVDLCELVSDVETPCEELVFEVLRAESGQAELLDDGHTVHFVPDPDYIGPAAVWIVVTDTGDPTSGPCDIDAEPDCELYSEPITVGPIAVEIDVLPVNDPPVAFAQEMSVREDGSVVITLQGFDPDGDEVSYIVVGEPTHGCWEQLGEAGDAVSYQPHDGYVGPDRLQFLVSDGELDSEIATVSITVTPLVAGFEFADGVLTVIGTSGNDTIRLLRAGRGYNVVTSFGTFNVTSRGSLRSMVVRGRDGNDTINVAALAASQPAELRGDGGNDRITGGAGSDILLGDAGNDILTGGSGDDLLVGGDGSDRLVGSAGNDLLIGGILDDPCRDLDLPALLDEWSAGTTPDDKLATAQPLIDLLLDDATFDMLTGGLGIDAFILYRLDRSIDRTAVDLTVVL